MGAFCLAILLLAIFLQCADSSSIASVKEGEQQPIDCSQYIIRPEDIDKMGKCFNQAIIDQIIKNVTDATNGKIKALEEDELPKMKSMFDELKKKLNELEKTMNSSTWLHNCHQDCIDWRNNGFHSSGIYLVCPQNGQPITVYCDMETDGGGWVVFQRRVDGSTNFTQRWLTYKQGFGDLNGDFWLGLDKIRLFMNVPNKLRIDLVAYNRPENKKGYGKYNNFHISDENTHYMLNVSDFTGNIQDQLHNVRQNCRSSGAPFSTYDRDHDKDQRNCAQSYGAGYWYNFCDQATNFPYTMLNGVYRRYTGSGASDPNVATDGIFWYEWPHSSHKFRGLVETKMMFKRKY